MANFLINIFKKAPKGDSYRPPTTPNKYVDGISKLNSSKAAQLNTPVLQTPVGSLSVTNAAGNTTTSKNNRIPSA